MPSGIDSLWYVPCSSDRLLSGGEVMTVRIKKDEIMYDKLRRWFTDEAIDQILTNSSADIIKMFESLRELGVVV